MSQDFVDNVFVSTDGVQATMAQIEDNFAALKSMFFGSSAPADLVAGMAWVDETAGKSPKLRNKANNAWLGLMQADASHKLWVYRNTAPDGWAIDAAVTDKVLALKGGSGAYNVDGGTTAGTWTQPDCTLSVAQTPAHDHGSQQPAITVGTQNIAGVTGGGENFNSIQIKASNTVGDEARVWTSGYLQIAATQAAHTHTSVGGGTAHNHGTAYRPAAAVGTLQYMDI